MYNRYAESGRIEWVQKYARYIDPTHAQEWVDLVSPKGDGLILRKITTDFKFVSIVRFLFAAGREDQTQISTCFLPVHDYAQKHADRNPSQCAIQTISRSTINLEWSQRRPQMLSHLT